jgi:lysosomal alpha-mannosidase
VTVHLLAHTHDDVGWLKTVDEYFTGAEAGTAHAGVKYVLDSILDALMMNPKRKFTYVEMKYFQMWYKNLS